MDAPPRAPRDIERRAFLRAGGALSLALVLEACRGPRAGVPSTSAESSAADSSLAASSGAASNGAGPPFSAESRASESSSPAGSSGAAEVEVGAEGAHAAEPALLPAPDCSEGRVLRHVAGLRPWRRGGIRLELEEPVELEGRPLVHDYGHGGAGITLAWGCAAEVTDLLARRLPPPAEVAVLGGGVAGLTCALRLREAGFSVRLLARELPPHTTSDLAGGQWAPSIVDRGRTAAERVRFARLLRRSHAAYARLVGPEWGVFRRPNLATRGAADGLEACPPDLVPRRELARLPLPGRARPGVAYETFLVEPPAFLARLFAELRARGVRVEERSFASLADVAALDARAFVGCLGLGAREVMADAALVPVRGQLVHLEPQALPYLLSHSGGYLFPRRDALVLGGTIERGVEEGEPDAATCRRIRERNARFFEEGSER